MCGKTKTGYHFLIKSEAHVQNFAVKERKGTTSCKYNKKFCEEFMRPTFLQILPSLQ
jgi:hypothetical protein